MSRSVKIGIYVVGVFLFITFSFYGYQLLYTPNLQVEKPDKLLYIREGASFAAVMDSLTKGEYLTDRLSFAFLSKLTGYQDDIHPGAFLIKANSNNFSTIHQLKSGKQTPVKLVFQNLRTKKELAKLFGNKLAFGQAAISAQLSDPEVAAKFGFDTTNFSAMFIPNTYEFFWNVSPEKFMGRMASEYKKFWTDSRKAKAKALGLTQTQVSILASIVECETKKKDEMPIVARVYKNRLDKNDKLQADPTVVFAVGDFTIKRVLFVHKDTDSRYNTYMYKGLPPGPIYITSPVAIDAVLDMPQHDYYFFCARPDKSGYHDFAVDYKAHMANARRYQQMLNENNIR